MEDQIFFNQINPICRICKRNIQNLSILKNLLISFHSTMIYPLCFHKSQGNVVFKQEEIICLFLISPKYFVTIHIYPAICKIIFHNNVIRVFFSPSFLNNRRNVFFLCIFLIFLLLFNFFRC